MGMEGEREEGRGMGQGGTGNEGGVLLVLVGYYFRSDGSLTTFVDPICSCYWC